MPTPRSWVHALEVPLKADPVDAPIVQYGGGMTAIHFPTSDGKWGRITFEKLDSIRICRGEYAQFPSAPDEADSFSWVSTVSNSRWLQERFEYEKEHYGKAYRFDGDVEEMRTDFSHYVFSFHDQFVEAIAGGIWFESAGSMLGERAPDPDHPLRGLAHLPSSETFETAGILCRVRRNPLSMEELERRAHLCSQPLLEVFAELDGRVGTDWSLTLRIRNGVRKASLRSYFGNSVQAFDHVPDFSEIKPTLDQWLREVRERRRKMGKE